MFVGIFLKKDVKEEMDSSNYWRSQKGTKQYSVIRCPSKSAMKKGYRPLDVLMNHQTLAYDLKVSSIILRSYFQQDLPLGLHSKLSNLHTTIVANTLQAGKAYITNVAWLRKGYVLFNRIIGNVVKTACAY